MKKALTLTFTLALLFMATAGENFLRLGVANPEVEVFKAVPIVTLYSPVNNGKYSSHRFQVNFTVTKPEGWLGSFRLGSEEYKSKLSSVYIIVDGEKYRTIGADSYLSSPFVYSENVTGLRDGVHNVVIQTNCEGWILETHGLWWSKLPYGNWSDVINFTIDNVPPKISTLSIGNSTYETSSIALDFTVSESTSKIIYSLDGMENVAVSGNTTLNGLSDGAHNITFYAIDEAGNIGASDTVYFSVDTVPYGLGFVAAIIIILSGAIIYVLKRKR